MRLLKSDSGGVISLTKDLSDDIPAYAILSHTWGSDEDEVTFEDLQEGREHKKAGYEKIRFCTDRAKKDGLDYCWIDTCNINKANHTELSEAITSMFRWYRGATKCYVYLSDVSAGDEDSEQAQHLWEPSFRNSRWFMRGWTLQELLAPTSVEFFSQEGKLLGSRKTLEHMIHEITSIPLTALRGEPLSQFAIDERLRWTAGRNTKKEEDRAYCLLGIFDVFMPLIYGEGDNAFKRLETEIRKPQQTENVRTGPLPAFNVPFPRDKHFVERGDLLERIDTYCSFPAGRTALVGLGGIGKSQLAIQHCYRTREKKPSTCVFWVYASNEDRFRQGYQDIAELVKIPGRQNPKTDLLKLVHDWLRDDCNGKWLLVLDNVDDAAYLIDEPFATSGGSGSDSLSAEYRRLIDYIPVSQNGSILITSRTKSAAMNLVEADNVIDVHPMELNSAKALLDKKLGCSANHEELCELAGLLEYMPLAMVQAASYISQRLPRCSVQQYIARFRKSDKSKTSLLDQGARQLRRDRDAKNSIVITWQISFDHIHSTRRSAAKLLSLMSFFDRQGIPEKVLRGSYHKSSNRKGQNNHDDSRLEEDWVEIDKVIKYEESDMDGESASESDTDDKFEEDILKLVQYSFISVSDDGSTFGMHSLVQLATRTWLETHQRTEHERQIFISTLLSAMPQPEYENWEICRLLYPHAKIALTQRPKGTDSTKKWCRLLYLAAWYACAMGMGNDAVKLSEEAVKAMTQVEGAEHPDTLSYATITASGFRLKGRYQEAETLQLQLVETSQRILGTEHPDTLHRTGNLTVTYLDQGRYQEAEVLQAQVVEMSKRLLGPEQSETLRRTGNLAVTYWQLGRYQEAEELQVQLVETYKRVLGSEHPTTWNRMGDLAATYWEQGRHKEAETIEVQLVEHSKSVLGPEHPNTLSWMANLASTYESQGRFQDAEALQVQLVEVSTRVLGSEHPDTLMRRGNLASTYWGQKRFQKAEQLEALVVESCKRVLGLRHPVTLVQMSNLALTWKGLGRDQEALELMEQSVPLETEVLGVEHPTTKRAHALLTMWQSEVSVDDLAASLQTNL